VTDLSKAVVAIAGHPYPMRLKGPVKDSYQALAPQVGFGDRMMLANTWLFSPWLIARISAQPSGAAVLHTTIAPTMLQGSPKENVLPQQATAWINFRIAPGDTSAEVMHRSQGAVRKLPVTLTWDKPPYEPTVSSSTTSRGWTLIAKTVAETFHAPVAPGLMRGGTDSWFMRGAARDTYLFTPMLLSPEEEKMIHGTNERISVKNLSDMVPFYARLVRTAAG
jgi:carboxypeptidase PM20D1